MNTQTESKLRFEGPPKIWLKRLLLGLGTLVILLGAWWVWTVHPPTEGQAIKRLGNGLPKVDRVEVIALGPVASKRLLQYFPTNEHYHVAGNADEHRFAHRRAIVKGQEAEAIAQLWRAQTFEGHGAACHEPGYALRFYRGPLKLLETTVCWMCSNVILPIRFELHEVGFGADSPEGQRLLKYLQSVAPLPSEDAYNYTNAPITLDEVVSRTARAVSAYHNHDFLEHATHSPQLPAFQSNLLAHLSNSRPETRRNALHHAYELRTPKLEEHLVRFLTDEEPEVRLEAVAHLTRIKPRVNVPMPNLLPLLDDEEDRTRAYALQLAFERTTWLDEELVALKSAIEAVLDKRGQDWFELSLLYRLRLPAREKARLEALTDMLAKRLGRRFEDALKWVPEQAVPPPNQAK